MTTVTSLHLTSSEPHTEMSKERQKTDQADISKMLGWIQSHNSFTLPKTLDKSLKSLESSSLNCDNAESVGSWSSNPRKL